MKNYLLNKIEFFKNPKFFSSVYYKLIWTLIILTIWFLNVDFFSSHNLAHKIIFLTSTYLILDIFFSYSKLVINYVYIKKNRYSSDFTDNFTVGINRLAFFLNHFIFILILIDVLFIEIKTLLTSLSIVAVAMVLIFKEYISNFLNGLNLMFSKDFRIKDTVKVGDNKGKIIDFTFHNVQIRNESGDIIFIPNSTFLTKEITNYSKSSLKNINFELVIPSAKLMDFEKNQSLLKTQIYNEFDENINSSENIEINYSKLEKETTTILFEVYLSKYSNNIEKLIKSFIISNLNKALNPKDKEKKTTKKSSKTKKSELK